EFALALGMAWLCEAPPPAAGPAAPCGRCGSCRLAQSHGHPDLLVLMPEQLRREKAWPLVDDKPDGEDSKRKPSRQIRIDETRSLVDWVYKTSARGRGKVALLHPAEALNAHAANALLKTLEEPPAGTRLLLTASDPSLLLPTVRSRCQSLALPAPADALACTWLADQGVATPQVLLAACSGRPLDALALSQAGISAEVWNGLPQAVVRGQAAAFAGWPTPRVLDALHKLCHDAMARTAGAPTRFFAAGRVPGSASMERLVAWQQELARLARHDEHPWNEGLLLDAIVTAGAMALATKPGRAGERLDTLAS
ncbi:MAG TPA: DNA polymerase III subunit delta', partial [Rubrivivax sp.]|nr:DNA polymerase III subunit delta' [Rubrivivax sp.]